MSLSKRITHWAHGLGSAIIGGSATALSSAAGIGTANALGIPEMLGVQHIPNLTWPQIGSIAIGGGFWTMVAYLKKSPLPPESTGESMELAHLKNPDAPKPPDA